MIKILLAEVIAEAADGQQAVALAAEHRPDIALMDIQMPVLDGLEATRQIVADERLDSVRVQTLTNREREVVALVAHGLSNDEIADAMVLSPATAMNSPLCWTDGTGQADPGHLRLRRTRARRSFLVRGAGVCRAAATGGVCYLG